MLPITQIKFGNPQPPNQMNWVFQEFRWRCLDYILVPSTSKVCSIFFIKPIQPLQVGHGQISLCAISILMSYNSYRNELGLNQQCIGHRVRGLKWETQYGHGPIRTFGTGYECSERNEYNHHQRHKYFKVLQKIMKVNLVYNHTHIEKHEKRYMPIIKSTKVLTRMCVNTDSMGRNFLNPTDSWVAGNQPC